MATQTPVKARTYRDFLTPLLHRRFTDASLLVLAVCWVEATLLSSSGILRAWNPLGSTGLRTFLLFIPCLATFIVRLSDLHFGARTAVSDWETLRKEVFTLKALFIVAWYMYSAFFFGEVYIWSKGQEANLGWVDYGKAYERPRLNENPMILRCLYQVLAVSAAYVHIMWDRGYVALTKAGHAPLTSRGDLVARLPVVLQDLVLHAGHMIGATVHLTVAGVVITLLIYHVLLRSFALQFAHFFGSLLYQQLPQRASFDGIVGLGGFLWQAVSSAIMLSSLWTFSNAAFSTCVAQPPLKNGQPLTSEVKDNAGRITSRSIDPNASLITGLKSKKSGPHTFALWELVLICTRHETRRKTIFLEVDRAGGSTWSQISQQCLAEIDGINARITAHQAALTAEAQPRQQANSDVASQQQIKGLPRIATEQVKYEDILTKPRPDLAKSVSSMARSAGPQSHAHDQLSPIAKRAFAWGKDQVFTPEQQAALSSQGISKETSSKMLEVLRTPVGAPFRIDFERTAKAVLFGSPYSSQINIVHAARTLAALLKASLVEDTCGVVAKDVPLVIRTFTTAIVKVRHFVRTTQPDWTDVFFRDQHRQIKEVAELVVELQKALEGILLAFSEYASSLGISKKELREAKDAVGMNERQEMIKV